MLTRDIATALSARLDGDGAIEIKRIVHPAKATNPSDLALAMTGEAAATLASSRAQAVVVSARRLPPAGRFKAVIAVEQGRTTLAVLTALFDSGPVREAGVHPTAVVAPDAVLGEGVSVGAHAVVGARSRLGARTAILPQATIGADVVVGAGGLIHSGVRIGDRTVIGERVIVHFNAAIGADGFSFAPDLGSRLPYTADVVVSRVHSLGHVVIGDDVEIGACTTIDRSTIEATTIGHGTKIDNQVHIGHNVTIGRNCIIAGKVGISGSVTIGDRVRIGGGAGIVDHVTIGTEAIVGAASAVATNVPERTFVSGYPAMPHQRTMQNFQYLARQKALHGQVADIISRLEALECSVKT
jgi:UDP-3-O-[3-hydroxymyristoyl] glucosamine N-acyltransferase